MKNVKWKNILQLQAVVIIYTISSVMAKAASGHKEEHLLFLLFFGLEFILLGIYALLWQQMIKKFVSCICQSCNGNSVVNDLGCSVLP